MLDGSVVLLRRDGHVLGGHIVLQVDKGLARLSTEAGQGGCARTVVARHLTNAADRRDVQAATTDRFGMCQGEVDVKGAGASANRCQARHSPIRYEHRGLVDPAQFAAGHGIQVHGRRPAAGAGNAIGGKARQPGASLAGNGHLPHTTLAGNGDDAAVHEHRHAGRRGGRSADTMVDDGRHSDAGSRQRPCHAVGAVAGCRDHDAAATGHAELGQVALNCAGQHDARAVVVGKQHRPFEGAGGQDDAFGADLPQPLAHRAGIDGLDRRHQAMVIQAQGGARGAQFDAGFDQFALQPVQLGRRGAAGLQDLACKPAAELRRAFEQQHLPPAARRRQRGLHARRASTDDQHFNPTRDVVVTIRIWPISRQPQAGHAPDHGLEQVPMRPHEGLVVKARRHEGGEARGQGRQVEFQTRPGVAGTGLQTVACGDVGGARVGRALRADADVEQSGGLFHAAAEDATRPVQLEAAPHQ